MAGGGWNVSGEGAMVTLALRLGPPIVKNDGNSAEEMTQS